MALPSRSKHGARTRALRGKDRAGPLYKGMDRGARRERHYGPWGAWENFKKNLKIRVKKSVVNKSRRTMTFFSSNLNWPWSITYDEMQKSGFLRYFFFDHFLSTIAKQVVK